MDYSFNLFGGDPRQWAAIAQAAERLGFRAIWISDHIITPIDHKSRYPHNASGAPGYSPDTPLMDPWVAIGHLGAATKTLLLGTGVYILPARNPVLSARAIASANYLLNGRVLAGIGTGWLKEEYDAVGADFHDRGKRMEEIVEAMRTLWTGKVVEHHGPSYDIGRVQFSPAQMPPPPIIFGGQVEAALKRAAKFGDGFYGLTWPLEQTQAYVRQIHEWRKEAGRDHLPYQVWVRVDGEPTAEKVQRYKKAGFEKLTVNFFPAATPTTQEQKIELMEKFARDVIRKV